MSQGSRLDTEKTEMVREEIVECIARLLPEDGRIDAFSDFRILRSSSPNEPAEAIYEPAFCFVAARQEEGERGK